jgi:hypothetical protein
LKSCFLKEFITGAGLVDIVARRIDAALKNRSIRSFRLNGFERVSVAKSLLVSSFVLVTAADSINSLLSGLQ